MTPIMSARAWRGVVLILALVVGFAEATKAIGIPYEVRDPLGFALVLALVLRWKPDA